MEDDELGRVDRDLGPRRGFPKHWSFKREISVGDILLAIVIVAPLMVFVTNLSSRVSVLEERAVMQVRIDDKQDVQLADAVTRVETTLRDVERALVELRIDDGHGVQK